jgi:hypothetical protein
LSLVVLPAASAAAGVAPFFGEVDFFGPTFDRPAVDGFDLGPSNWDVGYDAQPFFTRTADEVTFITETVFPTTGDAWDGAALIYADVFNPLTPEVGLMAYGGVGGGTFDPTTLQLTLEADRQYVFVQAGVTFIDFGRYEGTATGGDVVFGELPEPSIAAIAWAVGGLLLRRRPLG